MAIKPIYENKLAPCFSQDEDGHGGCPALNDIPGFLYAVSQKNFALAFEILSRTNPFSAGCGRFCDHPCESVCNRGKLDSPVNIRDLERFVAGQAFTRNFLPRQVENTLGKSVAIVGSGPAGLSAAGFLKRKGFKVDVFEKERLPGGMMTQGIPVFRYPTEIMQWEINQVRALGVNIVCGKNIDAKELGTLQDSYDYVVIATGTHKGRRLGISGEDNPTCQSGLEFLKKFNLNDHFRKSGGDVSQVHNLDIGQTIAVIGGGYTAIDVARTAIRLGKDVTVYYRRGQDDMDIHPGDIEASRKEGIRFEFYLNPVSIIGSGAASVANDKKTGKGCLTLKLEKMVAGSNGDAGPGGKSPIKPGGEFFEVRVDNVIKAIGETPDLDFLPKGYVIKNGRIEIPGVTKPLYIAGDARYGFAPDVGMVVRAIGSGRNTADEIIQDATNNHTPWYSEQKIAWPATIKTRYFKPQARLLPGMIKNHEATKTFKEIYTPLDENEAVYAASRCFFCGICIQCDWCFHYSRGAIAKIEKPWSGFRHTTYFTFVEGNVTLDTRDSVEACPRNAMNLETGHP